ncbi:hypothetical protein [Marinobacterium mangrovicola]|uniref:Uncharacterized protein n=1 Tax=Marinobacterium mangrovicola TaxID=1476959 RepID=A0A4R1GFQ2_9GAMM|nr:hypothetical protein [Marinobacterium mangrovicola]TCK07247.1 hypothetical protein CLV83_2106 [Marinobacterium mangrovicola]
MKPDNPLILNFSQPAQQVSQATLQADATDAARQLERLKSELYGKNQLIETKNKEISELKIRNRQLQAENQENQERQKLMDEELRRAETQIELIMELMNENQAKK